jgi:hypothetical protein
MKIFSSLFWMIFRTNSDIIKQLANSTRNFQYIFKRSNDDDQTHVYAFNDVGWLDQPAAARDD